MSLCVTPPPVVEYVIMCDSAPCRRTNSLVRHEVQVFSVQCVLHVCYIILLCIYKYMYVCVWEDQIRELSVRVYVYVCVCVCVYVCACVCVCMYVYMCVRVQATASNVLKQSSMRVQNAWGNLKMAGLRRYLMASQGDEEVNLARLDSSSSNLVRRVVELFEQLFFTPKVRPEDCRGHPRQFIFLWKSDCIGCIVLHCFCFFLPSFCISH